MDTRWIMVADASRARVFREDNDTHALQIVRSFEHEESRAHARDLVTDANGRKAAGGSAATNHGSAGRGVSRGGGAAPHTDPKEVEADKFARELGDYLEKQLQEHAYSRLVLAAPPHFLGLLQTTISAQVLRHVDATLHKDLTHLDTATLPQHVLRAPES